MFCPKCGKETAEGQAFCGSCGTSLAAAAREEAPVMMGAAASSPRTGTATAGLVLGIVGLVFIFIVTPVGFLMSVSGIICSALGLKSGLTRAKVGLGLSIAGIVLSIIWWALIGLFIWAL